MFQLEPGLVIWTVISFAVFVIIMVRYILPPFLEILDERQKKIVEDIKGSDEDRKNAAAELAEAKKHLLTARHEAERLIQESRLEADRERRRLVEEARAEVKRLLNQTSRELANERLKAAHAWQKETADLALAVAGKILKRSLEPQDQQRLLEESLKEAEKALGS